MNEPGIITAGRACEWTKELVEYPAVNWVLHYILLSVSSAYHLIAKPSGDKHFVKVSADDTRGWLSGYYDWTAFVTNADGDKHVVDTGVIKVLSA
ncbi:MAG: hypothetical protein OEZ39_07485 [Gammaproteobacteria bacterium]|nr:hypothetical protein [Gammaproteobacteria bacterium]MDH5651700.1 hypothetical protein [Gammaproteobacteria bacterium]